MTSARPRSSVVFLCLWQRVSLRARARGQARTPARVRACVHAVTLKNQIGLITESRSGGTEGGSAGRHSATPEEGKESE